jgi:hypothetical protein
MTLSPAEVVIQAFGGVRATARALGLTGPSVTYWRRVGRVPSGKFEAILIAAKKNGVILVTSELVLGRK